MGTGAKRRKRTHKNDKHIKKKYRTRRREKDLDQILMDLQPNNANKLQHQPQDLDLTGAGQHYCLTCARYFKDDIALQTHIKSKPHKRRLRALKEPVYTQREAENAAGQGNYNLPSRGHTEIL